MTAPQLERRRFFVTGCRQLASGRVEHCEWKLHEVKATTLDGKHIRGRLVSFEPFQRGEVEVECHDHSQYGAGYKLRRPRAKLAGRVEQLEADVRALVARVARLEGSAR